MTALSSPRETARDPERRRMVDEQIAARGVRGARVLVALLSVPRHRFVPEAWRARAYDDSALPIRSGQTISQPYIVARMTELLETGPDDRVLEVGTGSGYQAAVLAHLVGEVYSLEIVPELAVESASLLSGLGCENVKVREVDGWLGWPEAAPFDGIIVTAAAAEIPPRLVDQLKPGARMVIPVGDASRHQVLKVVQKGDDGGVEVSGVLPVQFVPLLGDGPRDLRTERRLFFP